MMVQKSVIDRSLYQISFPNLPLAVYREIAAHIRQVDGVEANLIPQTSQQFDYHQSQIAGLLIQFSADAEVASFELFSQILAYYTNRYGSWEEYDT